MTTQIGQQRYLSYNSSVYETPAWQTIDLTKDCKIPLAHGESDASNRGGGGFESKVAGLTALSFEWNMIEDRSNAAYLVLRAAMLAKSSIDIWASDLPPGTAGANGPRAVCQLFKFDNGEALGEVTTIDCIAKPTVSSHPPTWYAPS